MAVPMEQWFLGAVSRSETGWNRPRTPAQGTPRVSAGKNQMSQTQCRSQSGTSFAVSGEETGGNCGRTSATGAAEVSKARASREKSFCTPVRVSLAGTGWEGEAGCATQQLISWPGRQQLQQHLGAGGRAQQADGCAISICAVKSTMLQRMAMTAFIVSAIPPR